MIPIQRFMLIKQIVEYVLTPQVMKIQANTDSCQGVAKNL
jgi:hypothetical protein